MGRERGGRRCRGPTVLIIRSLRGCRWAGSVGVVKCIMGVTMLY